MKKLLTLILALSICCMAFVSCGDDTGSSSSGSSGGSSQTAEDTEELEPLTEITLPITEEKMTFTSWRGWSDDYLSNYGEVAAIQKIEELTNIHIDYTCVPGTAAVEKYGLMLAAGEWPDMIFDNGQLPYPGGEEAGVSDGVLWNMTDYVKYYMPNYRTLLEDREDIRRIVITDEGNNVGLYMIRTYVDGHNQQVVIENEPNWCGMAIRRDWLEELNMEVPVTVDDLHEVLVAFKENYGAWMDFHATGILGNDYILSTFGVTSSYYMDNGKVAYGPTTDGYKAYCELMRDWYAEGLINPDFTTNNGWYVMSTNETFATEKCGVGVALHGQCGKALYDQGSTDNPDFYLEPMYGVVAEEGDEIQVTFQANIALQPTYVTTSVPEEEMPILAQWLDWHYTYDYDVLNAYGVEGVSYEVDPDSEWYYVYTDLIKYPEEPGRSTGSMVTAYTTCYDVGFMDWKDGWQLYELTGNDWSARAYEIWGEETDAIMLPAAASFTSDESQEYDDLYLDIQTYVQEMTVSFILGTRDIDAEWQTYVDTVNGMNIARCIELKQTSVDRFNSKVWKLAE